MGSTTLTVLNGNPGSVPTTTSTPNLTGPYSEAEESHDYFRNRVHGG